MTDSVSPSIKNFISTRDLIVASLRQHLVGVCEATLVELDNLTNNRLHVEQNLLYGRSRDELLLGLLCVTHRLPL